MVTKTYPQKWYVAYTLPNAEKSVQRVLELKKIISFLPLNKVIRNWSDRKKMISIPLFPNYIFIYSSPKERYEALKVQGVVKYLSFGGEPATIMDEQIESIKRIVTGNVEVEERILFEPGNRVKIVEGPFLGAEGILEKIHGRMRLVVQLKCLNRTVAVEISKNMVSPVIS